MFESTSDPVALKFAEFTRWLEQCDEPGDSAAYIDRIRAEENLRCALAARQAKDTTDFVAKRTSEQRALGEPRSRVRRGIAKEVGLARRISHFDATRYVGQVGILTTELPETFARLSAGETSEYRVLLVARETAWLAPEHRATADREIAPQLKDLGNRKTVALAKQLAYRLDPHGYLARMRQAESERHVSVRPLPDNMVRLNATLPMKQGIAAYAALDAHARRHTGVNGETRSRSQLMADTLVERVTGQAEADQVSIQVNIVMTDQTLFNAGENSNEPAQVVGGDTIPAALARRMVLDTTGDAEVFLRRLYLNQSGQLAGMESKARLFTANQRHFLMLRDQTCRTPWCDAPVRHYDHIDPAGRNGPTHTSNGQGLCEACNYAKQAPGWRQSVEDDEIVTTTPTGHVYRSRAPDLPGKPRVA